MFSRKKKEIFIYARNFNDRLCHSRHWKALGQSDAIVFSSLSSSAVFVAFANDGVWQLQSFAAYQRRNSLKNSVSKSSWHFDRMRVSGCLGSLSPSWEYTYAFNVVACECALKIKWLPLNNPSSFFSIPNNVSFFVCPARFFSFFFHDFFDFFDFFVSCSSDFQFIFLFVFFLQFSQINNWLFFNSSNRLKSIFFVTLFVTFYNSIHYVSHEQAVATVDVSFSCCCCCDCWTGDADVVSVKFESPSITSHLLTLLSPLRLILVWVFIASKDGLSISSNWIVEKGICLVCWLDLIMRCF